MHAHTHRKSNVLHDNIPHPELRIPLSELRIAIEIAISLSRTLLFYHVTVVGELDSWLVEATHGLLHRQPSHQSAILTLICWRSAILEKDHWLVIGTNYLVERIVCSLPLTVCYYWEA